MKTFISVAVAIIWVTVAGNSFHLAQAADSPGEVHYIVADTNDQAAFVTTPATDRYLLMGFDSTPIILDITDEYDPFLLYGYEEFDVNGKVGAYFAYPGPAVCLAVGFDNMNEILSIDVD